MSGTYQVVPYEPGIQIDDPGWAVLNPGEVPIAITETEAVAEMLQQQLLAANNPVEGRLVAAAPAMLEALDNILNLTPDYTDPEAYVREVRLLAVDAVNKATVADSPAVAEESAGRSKPELQMVQIVHLDSAQAAEMRVLDAGDEDDSYQLRVAGDMYGAVISVEGIDASIVLDVSCGVLRVFHAEDDDNIAEYPAITIPLS